MSRFTATVSIVTQRGKHSLERIRALLPTSITLDPYFDASKDHLLASSKVYSELDNVAVVDGPRLALHSRRAQPQVVEKGSRAGLDVANVPLRIFAPKLAVLSRHDLGFESNRRGRREVLGQFGSSVTLRIPAHSNYGIAGGESSRHRKERERRARGARVVMRNESDRGEMRGVRSLTICGHLRVRSSVFGHDAIRVLRWQRWRSQRRGWRDDGRLAGRQCEPAGGGARGGGGWGALGRRQGRWQSRRVMGRGGLRSGSPLYKTRVLRIGPVMKQVREASEAADSGGRSGG
jgi:hypothetical protein